MYNYSDIFLLFSIYSFLGWGLETIYATIIEKKFVNRGFLTGVFCPIYGFGAILVILSSKWTNGITDNNFKSIMVQILFSIFIVTVLEYITGSVLEKIFDCKWWDYSNNALNVQGYICIKYSFLWGILAFLLIHVIHPVVFRAVASIPAPENIYLAVLLALYFAADTAKSIIDTLDLRETIINYSNLSANKYYEKVLQYKRLILAFPRLLILNAGIINRDVRSIVNDRFKKIKVELKSRFQQL